MRSLVRVTGPVLEKGSRAALPASQPGVAELPCVVTSVPGRSASTTVLPVRYWTVEEARAYLPRVKELISVIRGVVVGAASAPTNGHGPVGVAQLVQAAMEELRDGDIILRDAEAGLIDFHALGADGVVYLLCWKEPEPELAWWHLPHEGFAGRKALPRDPA